MASDTITDSAMIQRIMTRLQEIPENGAMKVVFDAKKSKMVLDFCYNQEHHKIEVYDRRFQTPSGGYHTANNDIELALYNDIDTLIHPKRKKKFAKLSM